MTFRIQIKLSAQFESEPDKNGYTRTVDKTVADIEIVADNAADAVRQAHAHTSLLLERHDDTPDPDTARSAASDSEECPF